MIQMHTFGKQTHALCFMDIKAHAHRHTHRSTFLKISPPPSRYLSNTYTPTHIPLTHPGFSHNVLKPIIAYTLSTERVSSAHWHMTPRTDRSHPAVCTDWFVCTVSTYCKCAELVCLCVCVSVFVWTSKLSVCSLLSIFECACVV